MLRELKALGYQGMQIRAIICAIVVGWCASAAAQTKASPQLELLDCTVLDGDELRQLVAVEVSVLGGVPPDIADYTLAVRCEELEVHLALVDPRENERLARTIAPHGDSTELTEREVAIAAAELLLAWNWVPSHRPAPSATQTPQGRSGGPPPEPPVEPRKETLAHAFVALRGRAAFRSLARGPLLSLGVEGEFGWRSEVGLGTGVYGGWLSGGADRATGRVVAQAGTFGISASFMTMKERPVRLVGSIALGASYVTLRGEPTSADYLARTIRGWLPEVRMSGGPAFLWGPTLWTLGGTFGWSLSDLEAQVPLDDPVEFGGPYLGIHLGILFPFRASSAPTERRH